MNQIPECIMRVSDVSARLQCWKRDSWATTCVWKTLQNQEIAWNYGKLSPKTQKLFSDKVAETMAELCCFSYLKYRSILCLHLSVDSSFKWPQDVFILSVTCCIDIIVNFLLNFLLTSLSNFMRGLTGKCFGRVGVNILAAWANICCPLRRFWEVYIN